MVIHEWKLVMDNVRAYGFRPPMLDIGGVLNTSIREYTPLRLWGPRTGKNIWSDLTPACDTTQNVQSFTGGPYGTIVSSSTLEHVKDLMGFFPAVSRLLTDDGLCFLSAPFRWLVHGDPMTDFWRFTPAGMQILAEAAGLKALETGLIEIDTYRAMSWIVCGKSARSKSEVAAVDPSDYLEVVPE